MRRRSFLGTCFGLSLGFLAVPVNALAGETIINQQQPWEDIIRQIIKEFIQREEKIILRNRKLVQLFGPVLYHKNPVCGQ